MNKITRYHSCRNNKCKNHLLLEAPVTNDTVKCPYCGKSMHRLTEAEDKYERYFKRYS